MLTITDARILTTDSLHRGLKLRIVQQEREDARDNGHVNVQLLHCGERTLREWVLEEAGLTIGEIVGN